MGRSNWKVEVLLAGSWRGATSVLISNGGCHIVVDTGMPHEAHLLIKSLEGRGLVPADVEWVVNTHFHVDHVLNNSLFPSSAIYATQESYDWCRSLYSDLLDGANWEKLLLKYYPETLEYARARENMGKLRKFALRWWDRKRLGSPSQFRWIETKGLPEGLESFVTSGHVPAHVSLIVNTQNQPTIIAGDALLSLERDDEVLTMIPCNREQFQRDRARILSLGGRVVPGHGGEFSALETDSQKTDRAAPSTSREA
jgi:glyoxylase-like metal-dependent hydrolase (beta-lactamase superfamily II)